MLAEMAKALTQHYPSNLKLPVYEEEEDFFEGTFQFGSTTVRIWYEHSLSYLSLMSDSSHALQDVAAWLQTL
jgi:hypothetical protein